MAEVGFGMFTLLFFCNPYCPGHRVYQNTVDMKKNMGNTDRIVRIIAAILIAILYLTGTVQGTLAYILLTLGVIFLLTSFVSFCPLYTLVGLNTCKVKN